MRYENLECFSCRSSCGNNDILHFTLANEGKKKRKNITFFVRLAQGKIHSFNEHSVLKKGNEIVARDGVGQKMWVSNNYKGSFQLTVRLIACVSSGL